MDELRSGPRRVPAPARNVVAVASGKGGVGKSTIALNLAIALSERGRRVGLLDADVYGPDIPRMLNLARKKAATSWTMWSRRGGPKWEPVELHGIRVMSMGFLVAEEQPVAWASGWVDVLLEQLFANVDWGQLDDLLVDLPPGTADLQQRLTKLVDLSGAVIVVTPQDVAHLDAKKVVAMFRSADVPVLGAVENMSGLDCPDCGRHVDVFPSVAYDRSIWADGVASLGSIPLHPGVAAAGDAGRPALVLAPDSAHSEAFRAIARELLAITDRGTTRT